MRRGRRRGEHAVGRGRRVAEGSLAPSLGENALSASRCDRGSFGGVAETWECNCDCPPGKVETRFYPVPVEQLLRKAAEPPLHPWFHDQEPPILLAAGRLAPQKEL